MFSGCLFRQGDSTIIECPLTSCTLENGCMFEEFEVAETGEMNVKISECPLSKQRHGGTSRV